MILDYLKDNGGDERYQAQLPLSSFKRAPAPAMGGRAAEQRRLDEKRSRSKGDRKKEKRVGQLDEKNLKRAANRYGTLPKGARIGAYLESLRGAGMTPEPVSEESGHDTLDSQRSGATDPGSIWSFIYSFVYSLICLFIHLFIHLIIHPYIHSCIYSFIHLFIHHIIQPFIDPFIH